jgi:hypothetical protein
MIQRDYDTRLPKPVVKKEKHGSKRIFTDLAAILTEGGAVSILGLPGR